MRVLSGRTVAVVLLLVVAGALVVVERGIVVLVPPLAAACAVRLVKDHARAARPEAAWATRSSRRAWRAVGLSWALFLLAVVLGGSAGAWPAGASYGAAVLAATASLVLALAGVWAALQEDGPTRTSHLRVGVGVTLLALVAMPFAGRFTLALADVADAPGATAARAPEPVVVDDDVFAPLDGGLTEEAVVVVSDDRAAAARALARAAERWMHVTEHGRELDPGSPEASSGAAWTAGYVSDVLDSPRGPLLYIDAEGHVPPAMADALVSILREELARTGVRSARISNGGRLRGDEPVLIPTS